MKNLFIYVALAMAIVLLPSESAEAHEVCESKRVWIAPAQDSRGGWRSGYWSTHHVCREVPPPPPPVVYYYPPTYQLRLPWRPVVRISTHRSTHTRHHHYNRTSSSPHRNHRR